MKRKERQSLKFNKVTISNLNQAELNDIRAGVLNEPCYENSWTVYYCKYVYTRAYQDGGDNADTNIAAVQKP